MKRLYSALVTGNRPIGRRPTRPGAPASHRRVAFVLADGVDAAGDVDQRRQQEVAVRAGRRSKRGSPSRPAPGQPRCGRADQRRGLRPRDQRLRERGPERRRQRDVGLGGAPAGQRQVDLGQAAHEGIGVRRHGRGEHGRLLPAGGRRGGSGSASAKTFSVSARLGDRVGAPSLRARARIGLAAPGGGRRSTPAAAGGRTALRRSAVLVEHVERHAAVAGCRGPAGAPSSRSASASAMRTWTPSPRTRLRCMPKARSPSFGISTPRSGQLVRAVHWRDSFW